jgi:hypothetical protein
MRCGTAARGDQNDRPARTCTPGQSEARSANTSRSTRVTATARGTPAVTVVRYKYASYPNQFSFQASPSIETILNPRVHRQFFHGPWEGVEGTPFLNDLRNRT